MNRSLVLLGAVLPWLLLVFSSPTVLQKKKASFPLTRAISTHPKQSRIERMASWRQQLEMLERGYSTPRSSRKRSTTSSANLKDWGGDQSYYVAVDIGTPPQSFNVMLGLILLDFLVPSPKCCSNTTISNKFRPERSSTWVNSTRAGRAPLDSPFGSGNLSGWIGSDTVSLGGFTVEKQVFGVAYYVPESLLIADPLSGFMGFGWTGIIDYNGIPWWQALIAEEGVLQEPLFSLYLYRDVADSDGGKDQPGGSLDLGFANSAYYSGPITYSNMSSTQLQVWHVTLDSVNINDVIIPLSASNNVGILEAVEGIIGAPSLITEKIYGEIPHSQVGDGDLAGYYTIPCNTTTSLSLTIAGISYSISPVDLLISISKSVCVGSIVPLNHSVWLLGCPFLKNVYSVYRFHPPAVGLAALSPAAGGPGASSTVRSWGHATYSVTVKFQDTAPAVPTGSTTTASPPSSSSKKAGSAIAGPTVVSLTKWNLLRSILAFCANVVAGAYIALL